MAGFLQQALGKRPWSHKWQQRHSGVTEIICGDALSLAEEGDPRLKEPTGSSETGGSARLQSLGEWNMRFFTHRSGVRQGFNQLGNEGLPCDVRLVAGDGEEGFPVHRAMMESASEYVKAMFTGGMTEQDSMLIRLPGVNKTGLKKVIDFIYTARLSLNTDNVQDALEAASFLQISPVLDFCQAVLMTGISLKNWAEVGRMAKTYDLTEVDRCVDDFILKNFPAFLKSGEFLKLSFERLAFILSSNGLKHCSELELFQAACRWLQAEEPRMEHVVQLLKHIHFPLMTYQEVLNHVRTVDFMMRIRPCLYLIQEAYVYNQRPYAQPLLQSERTAIRSNRTYLIMLGGEQRKPSRGSKKMRMYDEKADTWWSQKPMGEPRYDHGLAVFENFLYVAGGQNRHDANGPSVFDTVFRFDPRCNKWMQVASLNERRARFHLAALKGRLYAVGGQSPNGELATVECYSPWSNKWSSVAQLKEPLYDHAGTVFGGLMYISGGLSHGTCHKELMCFNPDTGKWAQRAPMTAPRASHCMCTVGDKLYVVGGSHFRGTGGCNGIRSCECYSPTLDQWTPIAAMLHVQNDSGVAVLGNRIYVVGGCSRNNRRMVEIVQKYDPEKDEWQKAFRLPESLRGVRACTLTVLLPGDNFRASPFIAT